MREVAYVIVALVALQRLFEVIYAGRNTRRLFARGATEAGRGHYPLIVTLHVAWLAAIVLLLPKQVSISWLLIAAIVLLQALRLWVIATLGPYWTTRIVTLDGTPLIRRGPYRWVRHPNYLIVAAEIIILPLAFGETAVAVAFTVLNSAILAWRIREEDRALSNRRALADSGAEAAKG